MAEKIRIKSLTKTDQYLDREWGRIASQRQYLLSMSDWTQMDDNDLTFVSRVYWNDWRRKVRDVTRESVSGIEEAESRLKILEENVPEKKFIESTSIRQKKYPMDISTIQQAKHDAINILKTLHGEWCIVLMPENINLINAKMAEVQEFIKSKQNTFIGFPLLDNMREIQGFSIDESIEYVRSLFKTSNEILKQIDSHYSKFSKMVMGAKSIDEILRTVKLMHGY